jgi:hypothetical protein
MRPDIYVKAVIWYMVAAVCILGMVPRVEAGFIPSQAMGDQNRAEDLSTIQKTLEMKMVKETLGKFGLTEAETQSRLQSMSDDQIHRLAMNIDEVRVGGDALGVIVMLLVIAILVVVLLQLSGHKIIVK